MKKLSKKMEPGKTEMKIYYNEGEQIKDPRLLKTSKISFHASGRIHYAGDQLLSKPLRILKEQHELCMVLFCHPAKYGIDKVKPHDIVLDYTGDESKPIIAQIFVAPDEKAKLVSHPTAGNQIHLVFEAKCLHNIPDLIIQILLIEPVPGPWPPTTYILFGHKAISQYP
jgi:hypothetical protein